MVTKIANIAKKASPILYRRTYTAEAHVAPRPGHELPSTVEFTLEQDAAGHVTIAARFIDAIDYPLVPALRALKRHISALYDQGQLR